VISADDFLWFVDEALNGMVAIVSELGDEGANRRPDLPGANSAYAILFHCLGVMEYWGGQVVAGRTIERDRIGYCSCAHHHLEPIAGTCQVDVRCSKGYAWQCSPGQRWRA